MTATPIGNIRAELATLLAKLPYFKGLDSGILNAVAMLAVRNEYAADQVVFIEGSTSNGLYIVESGWLKVIKLSSSGREQVLRFVGPGEVFNDVCAFVDVVEPATAVALESCVVWVIRRETKSELLDKTPALSRAVIRTLSQRMLQLVNLIEDLSLHNVEARLARFLLEHPDQDVLRRRRTTQADLAARVGTVPDVLNRALRVLVEEGLVVVERHQIRIIDRKGLRAKAKLAD
jgi:CRP/FNR family transcriptional regulator